MRNTLLFLFIVLTFASVSTKAIYKKPLIEMQILDQPILNKSQNEQIAFPQKSYSSERFSSRKKTIYSSTHNQNTLLQGQSKSKNTMASGGSIIGHMIIGSIIFFAGFPCLWFNERGYAYTKTFIRKYKKICKNVTSSAEVDPNNEGKLICLQGDSNTEENIVDTVFNMRVNNSIKLNRHCEMYQWVEESHSDSDGHYYYTYSKEWKNQFLSSNNYEKSQSHHNNEGDWVYNEQVLYAQNVTYGAFKLSELQKKLCQKSEVVYFTMDSLNTVAQQGYNISPNNVLAKQDKDLSTTDESSQINPPPPPNPMEDEYSNLVPATTHHHGSKTLIVQDDYLYIRHQVNTTSIGDFRIKFTKTPCGPITVIGKQQLDTLETFSPEEENPKKKDLEKGERGCCACCGDVCRACEEINAPLSEVNWVAEEKCKKKKIFEKVLHEYEIKTWLIRLLGFCCFWIGVYLMLSPIYTLMYAFPIFGKFLGSLGSFICALIGFVIAIPFSILTISIAWLFYRKEIGIPLLCVALIIIGYFSYQYAKDYNDGENESQKIKF